MLSSARCILLLALTAACSSSRPSSPSAAVDASALSTNADLAADAAAVEAGAASIDAGAGCVHAAYQPGACLVPDGELEDEALRGWFADRGAKVGENYPGYFARCHEVAFGPEKEAVLVCTTAAFVPGPLFGNGPMGFHKDLHLLTVRNQKAFQLLRLPLAFTEANGWDGDTLFSARYALDSNAGTLDLIATPEECESARGGVAAYHQEWVERLEPQVATGLPRDQIAARVTQGKMDNAHLTKICKAAGHYVPSRGGHMSRATP